MESNVYQYNYVLLELKGTQFDPYHYNLRISDEIFFCAIANHIRHFLFTNKSHLICLYALYKRLQLQQFYTRYLALRILLIFLAVY